MTDTGRLASIRRVDWRFMLPERAFTTVLVVGPADEPLLSGLGQIAGRVIRVDGEGEPDDDSTADLVVTIAASRTVLQRALRHVRPGGWVYAGAGSPRAPGRSSFREVAGALRSAGFIDLHRSWHWPTEPAALEIVPIDDASAVRVVLDRRRSGRSARVKAWMARIALRLRALDRIVPGWSVIGRRPWGDAQDAVVSSLDPVRASLPDRDGAQVSVVLLTPRFLASRHVVGLVLQPRGGGLTAVAKLPRMSGDDGGIQREAAALGRAAELGVSGVPEVLVLRRAPAPRLLESALDGVVIASRDVRASPEASLIEVEAWTRALAGPESRPLVPLRTLWEPALERIRGATGPDMARTASAATSTGAQTGGMSAAAVVGLVERTARNLDAVGDVGVPTVLEHGDLAPPNLLRLGDGRLGVVDWEVADPVGLPLGDLLFFAAFAAGEPPGSGATSGATALPPALGSAIERQAMHLGIDPRLIPALRLAMWARWADRQLSRFIDREIALGDRLPARHVRSWDAAVAETDGPG